MTFPSFSARLGTRVALLLAVLVALPACDSGTPDAPPDQILFGLNYSRLFAPATPAETAAVEADWAARNTTSSAATLAGQQTIDGADVRLYSHTVTAAGSPDVTHYFVVRVPTVATVDAPVLVVHHGGDNGFGISASTANTGLVQWVAAFPELAAQTVQVWPVYRSEAISTTGYAGLGVSVTAGGSESPWDYDVDDAIASVQATLAALPVQTSDTRRAAMGFSRGGNTAALHTIRDPEMDALVDYYGPTDFFNASAQLLASGVLSGSQAALGLPGAQFLLTSVLQPLIGPGGTYNEAADYAAARLAVVRRSASLFTTRLPDTRVEHHYRDAVVPVAFSQAFQAGATARGAGGAFTATFYGQPATASTDLSPQFHAPEGIPESLAPVQAFLLGQLAAARPSLAAAY